MWGITQALDDWWCQNTRKFVRAFVGIIVQNLAECSASSLLNGRNVRWLPRVRSYPRASLGSGSCLLATANFKCTQLLHNFARVCAQRIYRQVQARVYRHWQIMLQLKPSLAEPPTAYIQNTIIIRKVNGPYFFPMVLETRSHYSSLRGLHYNPGRH